MVPVRQGRWRPPALKTGSFQTARRIHPADLLVKSIAQYIGLVFLTAHNRAGSLRFYVKVRRRSFRPPDGPVADARGRRAGGSSGQPFFI